MIKCILTVGAPASGKSFWAKQEVAKDPNNWARINNDDIRAMLNGSVYSADYEKFIGDTRDHLIRDALKRGKNVVIDNVNANRRHFDTCCKIAKSINADVMVMEKPFYEELDVLIERDSKREGKAQAGEVVVKKWFKELGGKQHKHYKPRVEIFQQRQGFNSTTVAAPAYIQGLPEAVLCDLDGTLALIHGRSPYDASDCDIKDLPNRPVVKSIKMYHDAGYKIVFCSGRENKFGPETRRFIEKHLPNLTYELHMRRTDDFRKDAIIKEEIYQEFILGKFNVLLVLDDRTQVIQLWRSLGLSTWQVAEGDF